jgi:hypothetical protein
MNELIRLFRVWRVISTLHISASYNSVQTERGAALVEDLDRKG